MEYFGYPGATRTPWASSSGWTSSTSVSVAGEAMRNPEVALARIRRAQMVEAFIDSVEYRQRLGQP